MCVPVGTELGCYVAGLYAILFVCSSRKTEVKKTTWACSAKKENQRGNDTLEVLRCFQEY